MKKLLIIAAFLISATTFSFAQNADRERKTPEERAQLTTDAMEKKLTLSADQKTKIYQINLDRAKKMDEMRKADQPDRKKGFEGRKALMDSSDKKIEEILTADQKKLYDEYKAKARENMRGRRGEGSGGGAGNGK